MSYGTIHRVFECEGQGQAQGLAPVAPSLIIRGVSRNDRGKGGYLRPTSQKRDIGHPARYTLRSQPMSDTTPNPQSHDPEASKTPVPPESVTQLPPVTTPPIPPPPTDNFCTANQDSHEWRENAKFVLQVIGVVLLFVYTVFTVLQWAQIRWTNRLTREALNGSDNALSQTLGTMRQQVNTADAANRISEEQFRRDQRPYLAQSNKSTESPQFIPNTVSPEKGGQVIWNWHITNFGKTPAYDIFYTDAIKVSGHSFVSYRQKMPSAVGALQPTGDFYSTAVSQVTTLDVFNHLLTINEGISFRTVIRYRDSYGVWYETGLCQTRTNLGSIAYCKDGNYIK